MLPCLRIVREWRGWGVGRNGVQGAWMVRRGRGGGRGMGGGNEGCSRELGRDCVCAREPRICHAITARNIIIIIIILLLLLNYY